VNRLQYFLMRAWRRYSRSTVINIHAVTSRVKAFAVLGSLSVALTGCAFFQAPERGVDYPVAPTASPAPPVAAKPKPSVPDRDWRAAGSGLDAAYEKSGLLADTFYRNPETLLRQVDKSGAMGVNRGWEAAARKNGNWFIEEQRFADTVIGAGVNRNRADLIDAGLTALEWGFALQAADGGFPCRDNYVGASYFVAASAHALWLLDATGYARSFSQRIEPLRPKLERAALWLASTDNIKAAVEQHEVHTSRYALTGYALAAAARVTANAALASAGEAMVRTSLAKITSGGYFLERKGFDVSFQAEALVYLLRFYDHAATADMRREMEAPMRRALIWLESRVSPAGVVQVVGNTRSGRNLERDRTGQFRRVSAVAVSRAFGLARTVLSDNKFEGLARAVATAKQPV
jgi:hypothetical protein